MRLHREGDMVLYETDFEATLQHMAQVRNTTDVTRRVFENEVAQHVNALDNDVLTHALAKLIDEMMAFQEVVKREMSHVVTA
jgi:hypothetical protein